MERPAAQIRSPNALLMCQEKTSPAGDANPKKYMQAAAHACSGAAHVKRASITAPAAQIILAGCMSGGKRRRSFFPMRAMPHPVLRQSGVTEQDTGLILRKRSGPARNAARRFHGMLRSAETAATVWHPYHSICQDGGNSCAV